MSFTCIITLMQPKKVLILIILEVLYEILASMLHRATVIVLILIILEVLYELLLCW